MTAVTPTSQISRKPRGSIRGLLMLIAIALVASSVIFVVLTLDATSQDTNGTAVASPTAEELEELRAQAIAEGFDQLRLEFDELNDSGVEGTVTLYDVGEQTLVAILVEDAGDVHPAHIHEGTCDDLEPQPFAPLSNVENEEVSLSLVDTPLQELIDGDYAVDLHLSPNELGTLIVCANIEGTPVPATPGVGGISTPVATAEGTEEAGVTPGPTAEQAATETSVPTDIPATETPIPTETPVPTDIPPTESPVPTEVPPTEEVPVPDDAEEDGTGGPQAAPESVASLPLMDFSGLGVTGTVSLVALDDETTKVTIRLRGDAVTGGHIAHLHPGTCDNPQDEGTIYLATVDADGVSDTTVDLSISTLLNEAWVVNVHLSQDAYDTWLVCGFLGSATLGMTGVLDVTPVAGGNGAPISGKGAAVDSADGTSGVGKGVAFGSSDGTSATGGADDGPVTTLTRNTGIGTTVAWPESPTQAVIWALGSFALILATFAIVMRRAGHDHRQPPRWTRLGI